MIKGVIFDFNGTMIFDSHIHQAVWAEYIERLSGKPLSDEDFRHHILGHDTANILRYFVDENITAEEAARYGLEKEAVYRERCPADPLFHLVDGLEDFLDLLKSRNIALNIATGSDITNMRFYFEQFPLSRWFDFNKVVYDDGTFPGKPAPDVYARAAERIGIDPADCVVFEDASSGVLAAHRAGIDKVVIIHPKLKEEYFASFGGVMKVIPDFNPAAKLLGFKS